MRFLLLALLALPTVSFAEEKQEKSTTSAVENERLAVVRAARQFRIEVFERFRRQRESYNAYDKQGENVLRAWAHPMSKLDHKHVVNWFATATRNAHSGIANPPAVPSVIQQSLLHIDSLPETKLPRRTVEKTAIDRTPIEALLPLIRHKGKNVKGRKQPRKKAKAKFNPTRRNAQKTVLPPAPAAPLTEAATPSKSKDEATAKDTQEKK